MDCRTCQPTLLDLAYGELAPELATVVRAHVDGCDSCNAQLKAIRQGIEGAEQLAWLEPPPSLRVNALAYAEQHVRERSQAIAAKAAHKPRATLVHGLFDFIGRLASGRQVAMATVMVLVVAVGVWVIPELQPLPEGQGVTVVSPDPEAEAAPSGGLAPAEPLDLTVDARNRRIRSREEIEHAAQLAKTASDPSVTAAPAGDSYATAEEEQPVPPPAAPAPLAAAQQSPVIAEEYAEQRRSASMSRKSFDVAKAKRGAPEAFPESELGRVAQSSSGAGSRARAAEAPPPASKSNTAEGSLGQPLDREDDALAGLSADSVEREAKDKGSASVSSIERARALRRTEGCGAALPAYEQAVQEYSRSMPQSSVLGTALLELAECQWQVGRASSARATLKRAEQVAPVAVRARALLDAESQPAKPAAAAAPAADTAPSKD